MKKKTIRTSPFPTSSSNGWVELSECEAEVWGLSGGKPLVGVVGSGLRFSTEIAEEQRWSIRIDGLHFLFFKWNKVESTYKSSFFSKIKSKLRI